jgi:hypothetical protein
LALGDDGHRKIEQATVAIVGLGGLAPPSHNSWLIGESGHSC